MSNFRLPPPAWLLAFETAARHESFAAAAGELSLTSAAISHQVRSLERHLGHALFERTARGLALTDWGRAYLPSVRAAFEDLTASTNGLFGTQTPGTLYVRAPFSFTTLWLIPRLPQFMASHPHFRLRLFSTIKDADLPNEKFDFNVTLYSAPPPGFKIAPLCNEPWVLVQPPDLAIRELKDIPDGSLIHIAGQKNEWSRLCRQMEIPLPTHPPSFVVDTAVAALELIAAGLGFGLLPRPYAQAYADKGRVKIVPDIELLPGEFIYLLTREQNGKTRLLVRMFSDWLISEANPVAGRI